MLTEGEVKAALGHILGLEEHGPDADWYRISRLSVELLSELPQFIPPIVRSYLSDTDIRRVSRGFAGEQLSEVIRYLRE